MHNYLFLQTLQLYSHSFYRSILDTQEHNTTNTTVQRGRRVLLREFIFISKSKHLVTDFKSFENVAKQGTTKIRKHWQGCFEMVKVTGNRSHF